MLVVLVAGTKGWGRVIGEQTWYWIRDKELE